MRVVPQSSGQVASVSSASHSAFPQQLSKGSPKIQPWKGSHVSFNVQALLSLQVTSVLEQMPVEGLQVSTIMKECDQFERMRWIKSDSAH